MIKTKQITFVASSLIRVSNFSATAASSNNVTTVTSSALAIAGRGAVSVPLQVSTNEETVGVITTGTNLVQIQRTATGEKIADAQNNEVYGRLTETGGVYTLSYFSNVAGVETAFSFTAATNIDFDFAYRFDFSRLPADFAITVPVRIINNDPRGSATAAALFTELLNVTALNTIANLTKTPNTVNNVFLIVNDALYSALGGGSAPFAVTGKAIAWNAVNAKFNLEVTDRVIAFYTTSE